MSDIYTIVTSEDDDSNISNNFFNQMESPEASLFLQVDEDGEVASSQHLEKSGIEAYKSKRKIKTLIKSMVDDSAAEVGEILLASMKDKNFFLIIGESIDQDDLKGVGEFLIKDANHDENSNLAKFAAGCKKGHGIRGAKIVNGEIQAIGEIDIREIVNYNFNDNIETDTINEKNAAQFIRFVAKSIEYNGFNPKAVLKNLLKDISSPDEQAATISVVLAAYIRIGNNMQKLNGKRVNQLLSKRVIAFLQKIGIKRIATSADGITLARVAIAMPGELLVMRRALNKTLQSQVDSGLDAVYQDLAFQGVPDINSIRGYNDYAIEFSSLIYRKKKDSYDDIGVSESDTKEWAEFIKNFNRWDAIARSGYSNNKLAQERFAVANNLGNNSEEEAFKFFKSSAAHYLKD